MWMRAAIKLTRFCSPPDSSLMSLLGFKKILVLKSDFKQLRNQCQILTQKLPRWICQFKELQVKIDIPHSTLLA